MKYLLVLSVFVFNISASAQGLNGLLKKASNIVKESGVNLNSPAALSNTDIINGLKEALTVGADKGCLNLSKTDGFFKNAALKILMPPEAQKVENTIRGLGMNQLADDFILSLNRAAEDACKTASPIFIKAIKDMTITDGLNILKGSDSAATQYLKLKTQNDLSESFKPVIKQSLEKVDATKYWTDIVNAYNAIPFVNKKVNADLAAYVTEKSMNGIYGEIAHQEKEIRANPVARTTDLLKRVFEKK